MVGGVSLAVAKELSFSWLSFGTAMGSNLAFACRAVFSKLAMGADLGANMSAPNLFGVVTILATLALAPVALALEGGSAMSEWSASVTKLATTDKQLLWDVVVSGFFHYTNNEVQPSVRLKWGRVSDR